MLVERLRRSLFAKIVLASIGLLAVFEAVDLTLDFRSARSIVVEESVRQGTQIAQTLAFTAETALAGAGSLAWPPGELLQNLIHRIGRDTEIRKLAVLDRSGAIVAEAAPGDDRPTLEDPAIREALATDALASAPNLEEGRVCFAVPLRVPGGVVRTSVLHFTLDIRGALAAVHRRTIAQAVAVSGSSLAVAGALLALLYIFVLRPTQRLAGQAERLGTGDLAARSGLRADPAGDEIQRLAHAFDAMATEIQRDRDALARQERRLELTFAAIDESYWDWDLVADRGFHSGRLQEILGFGSRDTEGSVAEWTATIHPDDRAAVATAWADHAAGRRPRFEVDYRIRTREGEWRWFRSHGRIIERTPEGAPARATGTVKDITERLATEAALKASERRLELTLQSIGEGYWDWDLVRDVSYNSPQVAAMLGYETGEIGETWRDWSRLLHPDDAPRVLDVWRAHYRGEADHYEAEYRMRTKAGDWKWVFSRGRIVEWDPDGTPRRATGSNQDVDARKRAEQALRASEERFRKLVETTSVVPWEADPQTWRFTYIGPQAARLLGYPLARWYEPDFWREHVHPDDRAAAVECRTRATERGEDHTFEYRMIAADGSAVWVRDIVTVPPDRGSIWGFLIDVTEAKRADEALRVNRERLARAFDAIEEGYWDWDLARGHVYSSARLAEMIGYHAGEVGASPQEWFALVHGDDRPEVLASWRAHLKGRTPLYEVTYRMRTKGGEWRWIRSRGKVVERSGDGWALRASGANQDVTAEVEAEEERREVEARLVRAEKLESLAVLAGGVAHDFNNLLVGILGNASLALDDLPADAPARESIARIEQAAHRAAELANQMLAYSGRGRLVTTPVALADLVAETADLLRAAIPKHVALEVVRDGAPPLVEGDATQLRQVVMNLLTNAAEAVGATPGRVVLRTGRVAVGEDEEISDTFMGSSVAPGEYAYVEVSDDGAGMDAETLARICDPFFTTKRAGRGLGLAGVQGIVRGHGGALLARSAPGAGTTIRVLLPQGRRAPLRREERPRPVPPRGVHPACVLVVDDEEAIRQVARRILEAGGYRVLAAADGDEGLETFRKHSDEIALVLLDLTMPRKSGEEVFGEISDLRPGTPVIVTSGFASQEVSERFHHRRPADVLQKPFSASTLLARVGAVLAGAA